MKKLLFSLLAVIMLSVTINANVIPNKFDTINNGISENPQNWIRLLALIASIDFPDIDYQKGTNKVIDGKRYECIDGGVCRIRTGGSKKNNVEIKKLNNSNHIIIDENGVIAILINKVQARANDDFNLQNGFYSVSNSYLLKSIENCPQELEKIEILANNKYDLEELDNHYAIILKK